MPDDHFDAAKANRIRSMDANRQRAFVEKWFRSRYRPPEDIALVDTPDLLGGTSVNFADTRSIEGPFNALEVLIDHFSNIVDDNVLELVADDLEREAAHWFLSGEDDRGSGNDNLEDDEQEQGASASEDRDDIDQAMPAEASPLERMQIRRLLENHERWANQNDPEVQTARADRQACKAILRQRIEDVRAALKESKPPIGPVGETPGPGTGHNNPPPDKAAEAIITPFRIDSDFEAMLENLADLERTTHQNEPEPNNVKSISKSLAGLTARLALNFARRAGGLTNKMFASAIGADIIAGDLLYLLDKLLQLRVVIIAYLVHLGIPL
jgi:hypothetical protein